MSASQNQAREDALHLLENLTANHLSKRSEALLRPHDIKKPYGDAEIQKAAARQEWFLFVPKAFNAALDIAQTSRTENKTKKLAWTQGNGFAFKAWDVLYDTPEANQVWSQALQKISLALQIKEASEAFQPKEKDRPRYPGRVTFAVFSPNPERTQLIKKGTLSMTQDDFIRFLIDGDEEVSRLARSQTEEELTAIEIGRF